jgi:predicted Zn-dependent protease with MMP-like domain
MRRSDFRRLVSEALHELPPEFAGKMSNVEVVVAALPTPEQEESAGGGEEDGLLMGLYEGIPLTERTSSYGGVLPDRITIFQDNIEAVCETEEEMREEIRRTVLHEIAHHFGIEDENALEDWGY